MKTLTTWELPADIGRAFSELAPIAVQQATKHALDGAVPVATPTIMGIKCVACVYADRHQDLPFPRYSILAPLRLRPNAGLSVDGPQGVERVDFTPGRIVVLDAHRPHWVDKPSDYPMDWQALPDVHQKAYNRDNLLVFANLDMDTYPTLDSVARRWRQLLCLPQPYSSRKMKR